MKKLKVAVLSTALIAASAPSFAQLEPLNGLVGGLFGAVSSLSGPLSALPVVDLSPLLSLEDGIPVLERLPVVTSLPVVSDLIGDGRGPDPITLVGEVLGLQRLPLEFLFDGTIPF